VRNRGEWEGGTVSGQDFQLGMNHSFSGSVLVPSVEAVAAKRLNLAEQMASVTAEDGPSLD
jgi:hypothetical protein